VVHGQVAVHHLVVACNQYSETCYKLLITKGHHDALNDIPPSRVLVSAVGSEDPLVDASQEVGWQESTDVGCESEEYNRAGCNKESQHNLLTCQYCEFVTPELWYTHTYSCDVRVRTGSNELRPTVENIIIVEQPLSVGAAIRPRGVAAAGAVAVDVLTSQWHFYQYPDGDKFSENDVIRGIRRAQRGGTGRRWIADRGFCDIPDRRNSMGRSCITRGNLRERLRYRNNSRGLCMGGCYRWK
jgi:hypothetical protein